MSVNNGRVVNLEENPIAPQNTTEEEEDLLGGMDLEKIFGIIRKNFIWLFLMPLVCLSAGYLFLRYTSPVYESSSSIKLEIKQKANLLGITDPQQDNVANISGEIELIRSKLIYDEVIKRMDLNVSYVAYGRSRIKNEERYLSSPFRVEYTIHNPSVYDQPFDLTITDDNQFVLSYSLGGQESTQKYAFGQEIRTNDFHFIVRKTPFYNPEGSQGPYYFVVNSPGGLSSYLSDNLRVEVVNPSANIIGIFFKDENVTKAHDVVNTIDSVYLTKTKELKNKANKQKILFLEEQLQKTENELQSYESELEAFISRNKSTDIQADVGKFADKLDELIKARTELETQLALLDRLQELINSKSNLALFIPSLSLLEDNQLGTIAADINRLEQEKAMLATTTRETTTAYRTKEKQIQLSRERIAALISHSKKLISTKVNQLNADIGQVERTFANLPAKGTEYNRIKRLKDLKEKYYLLMIDKKAELGIAEAGTVEEFVVLSPASKPVIPIYPNKLMIYAGCGFAGLFFSFLIIGSKYLLHDTISNQRELERATSAPILGIIPAYTREKMDVSRLVVHRNPKASISEALRSIRTNLDFIFSTHQKKKIISITSTISGEGKTFVAINLGGVIAMSGVKVVLIDLDMRRPKVHLAFDEENFNGISTLLIGKHTLAECIRKTSIETMDFIAAGPTPPNPSELILRPEFDKLLKDLHQQYDIIVIDTPPIGLVTDGVLVMRKSDLPIYVVRADYSKRVFIKNINKLIKNNNFSKLAVVLNAFQTLGQYGYGGYSYGYGQNYYEDNEEAPKGVDKLKGLLSKIR